MLAQGMLLSDIGPHGSHAMKGGGAIFFPDWWYQLLPITIMVLGGVFIWMINTDRNK